MKLYYDRLPLARFVYADVDCYTERSFWKRYRVVGASLPFVVVADGDDVVKYCSSGWVNEAELKAALRTVLEGGTRVLASPWRGASKKAGNLILTCGRPTLSRCSCAWMATSRRSTVAVAAHGVAPSRPPGWARCSS